MIRQVIIGISSEQLKLPFFLWSREAVQELIQRKCGVGVSINTAGNYLRAWGFTVQKPVRRAYEQNAAAVRALVGGGVSPDESGRQSGQGTDLLGR